MDKKILNKISSSLDTINEINPLQKPGENLGKKIGEGIDLIADILFNE